MSEARIHLDAQVQVRRDTEANWVAVDPVLRDGEIAYSRDINRIKIGDGAHKWSELEYMLSVDAPDYEDIDLSGYAKKEDVATLADHLASMWSLDDDGNLVTEKNVIIKKNLTIGGDTSTGGTGEDTGVSGTVTGIRVDADTILEPTNGIVDMSDVLANLDVDVDLSDYYTKQETTSEIAKAVADLNLGQYATTASLATLQTEVDNIEAVLGMDEEAAGIINTWNEVKAFLDGYSSSDDLATILSGMNADIATRALNSDLDELALTVGDNTTNIRNLKDSVYTKEDLATYKSWWDDLMPLIVKEGNDIKIKTNLIVAGDTSSGGTGSNPEVAGTLIGIKVNGQTYKDPVNGILTIPDYPTSLEWSAIEGRPTKVSEFFNDSGFITSAALVGYATQSWVEDKKYLTSHQSIYGLTIKDSAGGSQLHFNPAQEAKTLTLTKAMVGLGNVEDKSSATIRGEITSANVTNALGYTPLSTAGGTISGELKLKESALRFIDTNNVERIFTPMSWKSNALGWYDGSAWQEVYHTGNFNPADYLPLSGGTLGSGLSNSFPLLISSTNDYTGLAFYTSGGTGYMRFQGGSTWGVTDAGWNNSYTLIHSGNIGSYAPQFSTNILLSSSSNLVGYTYETGGDTKFPEAGPAMVIGSTSGAYKMAFHSRRGVLHFNSMENGTLTGWKTIAFTDSNVAWSQGLKHSNGTVGAVVNSSGNVTIGASDLAGTSVKLYVAGAVRIGVDNSISTTKGTGTLLIGADRHLAFDANDIQAKDKDGNPTELYINDWGGDIIFGGAGSGNVLIGTTTDSGYKLDVNGTARISGAVTMSSTLSVGGNIGFSKGFAYNLGTNASPASILYTTAIRCAVNGTLSLGNDNGLWAQFAASGALTVHKNTTINGNLVVAGDTSTGSDIRFKDKLSDHHIALSDIAEAPLFTFKWNDREDDSVHLGTSAQYWEKVAPWLVKGTDFKALDYSTLGVAIGISLANKTLNHEERIKILENKIEALEAENRRLRYGS